MLYFSLVAPAICYLFFLHVVLYVFLANKWWWWLSFYGVRGIAKKCVLSYDSLNQSINESFYCNKAWQNACWHSTSHNRHGRTLNVFITRSDQVIEVVNVDTVVWPVTDCRQRRPTHPTSLYRQSACSPQLAITWRRCVCRWPPTIGVNATGDAGDASPAIFGEPGTKCLISPQKPVKIVTNREARKA